MAFKDIVKRSPPMNILLTGNLLTEQMIKTFSDWSQASPLAPETAEFGAESQDLATERKILEEKQLVTSSLEFLLQYSDD
jgi:hypothetical protein